MNILASTEHTSCNLFLAWQSTVQHGNFKLPVMKSNYGQASGTPTLPARKTTFTVSIVFHFQRRLRGNGWIRNAPDSSGAISQQLAEAQQCDATGNLQAHDTQQG